MAKEDIKEEKAVEVVETKTAKKLPYKVKKEFTLDKLYKPGSEVLLEEGKVKETLISNKFI